MAIYSILWPPTFCGLRCQRTTKQQSLSTINITFQLYFAIRLEKMLFHSHSSIKCIYVYMYFIRNSKWNVREVSFLSNKQCHSHWTIFGWWSKRQHKRVHCFEIENRANESTRPLEAIARAWFFCWFTCRMRYICVHWGEKYHCSLKKCSSDPLEWRKTNGIHRISIDT